MYKGWLNFLNEEQSRLPQIYCDMDGVLVDFETGVVNEINSDLLDNSIPDRKPTGGLASNLSPQPEHTYMSHEKWKWATTDGRPNILIDDWDKNLIPWAEHGGIAIRCAFGDSASAIAELKELGFGAE